MELKVTTSAVPAPQPESAGGSGVLAAVGSESALARTLGEAAARQLSSAVARVAAAWDLTGGLAFQEAELVHHLEAVAGLVDPLGEDAVLGPMEISLRRRLLELVRAELIELWADPTSLPAASDMVRLLEHLEASRRALDPDPSNDLRTMLLQPSALELLVEIAHDLRSPLTSILFLSDSLGRGHSGDINDVQRQQLGIIYSAALGLLSVASDVVELARDGDRLSDQEYGPFSLLEMFESVRDMVQPVAEQKGLTLRLLPLEPDQRLGHPVALSRVLLNLTTNALKYTEEGVVEIVARAQGPSRVEFSVRDTGNGIDSEIQQNLFRPFTPARQRSRYSFSQTGLGLSICRKLVRAMGSELQMETAKGWGTRFFFELELPPHTSPMSAHPTTPPSGPRPGSPRQHRSLRTL